MKMEEIFNEFKRFGNQLFIQGLNSSHSGNMSIRDRGKIIITRRGAILGDLGPKDLIVVDEDGVSDEASTLFHLHQTIYKATDALAIIHAHPPYAIALSMTSDEIIPFDFEGKLLFKKIPVIDEASIDELMGSLKDYKAIILRAHGSIAIGDNLEEAFMLTSSLAHVSKSIFLYLVMKQG